MLSFLGLFVCLILVSTRRSYPRIFVYTPNRPNSHFHPPTLPKGSNLSYQTNHSSPPTFLLGVLKLLYFRFLEWKWGMASIKKKTFLLGSKGYVVVVVVVLGSDLSLVYCGMPCY